MYRYLLPCTAQQYSYQYPTNLKLITMLSFALATRRSASLARSTRHFADVTTLTRPARGTGISLQERAALRAARKERATKMLEQQKAETSGGTQGSSSLNSLARSRYFWHICVGVPSALLVWGFTDENSPPAKFCRMIGLTDLIRSYTEEIAKPSHNKLLPDWSQVRKLHRHTLGARLSNAVLTSSIDLFLPTVFSLCRTDNRMNRSYLTYLMTCLCLLPLF
jgi:hypothetical protein